ncbi:putative N acetyltransferase B complex (NatB) non catalytic subunit [Trypanosoma vivax]|uniref:N-acetyltransferase B complex (NatB) non catalytic subunit n=1 Tax=Trypanosoma vivax (strain Y486) TaxID=1055687 RepID=G0TWL2_TRYVY|nr:hypothetical protein TRVL_03946 [Trypanosoma vivax]KAH8609207.1 putative N acetyltransferase B complex (NatB) non catalytic subunit [Trypanosoma vivax]CCC48350.1 conserved hypothetical protein [Trypanosoma vivax Y486]
MPPLPTDRAVTRIFDLIDAGKNGQAEGALQEMLPKFPNDHALRAAECLLLLRNKEVNKARDKVEALGRENVTDPKAVNALIYVLQQCCCWVTLAKTFERLKEPHNERSTLENLFQTYVRMGAYDQAHKVAMELNHKWSDPRYLVWMVQASLAQVPPDSCDHTLLKVSTKLLDSSVLNSGGVLSTSTSRMYVEVLKQQKLYGEAAEFLCSQRGAAVGLPEARLEMLAVALQNHGDIARANAISKYLWARHPDNWAFVKLYLDSLSVTNHCSGLLVLDGLEESKRISIELSDVDRTMENALCFTHMLMDKVRSDSSSHRQCRGPFLAELEILSRMNDKTKLYEAVFAYAKRFYQVACCYMDISTYLDDTSATAIYQWSQEEDASLTGEGTLRYHARKILGLSCYVGLWGTIKEQQPDHAEVNNLLEMCCKAYEGARSLSTCLARSEKGLCDEYITVALNALLCVYHATKDLAWIERGLAILDNVDRRENNPSWLVYSLCFARMLGLADIEAWRQLDFKSIQHDTMSHVGYWPLVASGAVVEVCQWNNHAWEHYTSLYRDCCLLRSKVFVLMSWPAMKDVQEFERKQTHSLAKIVCSLHRIVGALRSCQTQRNVFELMEAEEPTLSEAFEALHGERLDELTENTDWVVVRSMVLGNIRSKRVEELTDTLIGMPTVDYRIGHICQLLGSLVLLHDVALLEEHRVRLSSLPRPKKQKGKTVSTSQAMPALPTLLSHKYTGLLPALPVIEAIKPALMECITMQGSGARVPHNEALRNALQVTTDVHEVQRILFPDIFVLIAILQIGPTSKLPVAAWAAELQEAMEGVREVVRCIGHYNPSGKYEKKLREINCLRLSEVVTDMCREALAASRRR